MESDPPLQPQLQCAEHDRRFRRATRSKYAGAVDIALIDELDEGVSEIVVLVTSVHQCTLVARLHLVE